MKSKLFASLMVLCLCFTAFAQTRVSGVVSDNVGPAIGVSVIEQGTTNGTVTDVDGNFSLTVRPGATLVVSSIGYKDQVIEVGNQTSFNILIEEDNELLEEVVVVGYGVQKKKLVTGSTVQVKGDDLTKLNTTSALGALQSQTPGMQILSSSGQPGEGFKVTIRGMGTIGSYSPLYVIDGVAGGDINALNPSDIESIDVLKDAASCAIYGARGANGVVLVTTKQGKAGKVQVTYDGFYGIQNVARMPEMLTAQQYMDIQDQTNFNAGKPTVDWAAVLNPDLYNSIKNGSFTGTNWLDLIRNVNAPTTNHAVNIAGGNDLNKYALGVSYTAQEGIFGKPVASDYSRTTARINGEHVIWRKNGLDIITFGENMTYTSTKKSGIAIGNHYWNNVYNAISANPLLPAFSDETASGYTEYDQISATGLWNVDPYITNPIASMVYSSNGNNENHGYSLRLSGNLKVQPIKNLVWKSQFNYSMSSNSYRNYAMAYNLSNYDFRANDTVSQSGSAGWSWSWENTVNYKFNLGKNNFDVLAGNTLEHSGFGENMGGTASNGNWKNDWSHAYIDMMLDQDTQTASGSLWGDSGLVSFFGRINYDYAEKYMLSLILRRDGSSNFMTGHRWGTFPSVSAGWVITNEDWWKADGINFLKLRGSWGQNGNCNVSGFQYLATVAVNDASGYSFGTGSGNHTTYSPGAYADKLANEDISWETSQQLDLGFDARMFKNRMSITFDWYQKDTKDWLVNAPVMGHFGANAPYINGGDVRNSGVELAINWNDAIGKDFSYNIGINGAYNKNQVTRIANEEGIIHGAGNVVQGIAELYRAQVGFPIGYFWTYQTDGVFQNQQEIDEWVAAGHPVMRAGGAIPGDLKFVDTNGDGSLSDADKTMTGDPNPHFTAGVNLSVYFKGFDLAMSGYGAFGHQIFRAYRRYSDSQWNNYTTEVYNYWHGEGTSNRYPRLTPGTDLNFMNNSDIFIEDADFFRIQTISLGYDLARVLKKVDWIEKAHVYVQAQNPFVFTKYMGMDPEVAGSNGGHDSWASGIDMGYYPQARTLIAGINLAFGPKSDAVASTYSASEAGSLRRKAKEIVKEVEVIKEVPVEVIKEVPVEKVVEKVVEKIVYQPVSDNKCVYFTLGESDITSTEAVKVNKIAKELKANPGKKVYITGYADKGTGNDEINLELTKKRAAAVSEMLQNAGVSADRITIEANGAEYDSSLDPEDNRVAICIIK